MRLSSFGEIFWKTKETHGRTALFTIYKLNLVVTRMDTPKSGCHIYSNTCQEPVNFNVLYMALIITLLKANRF